MLLGSVSTLTPLLASIVGSGTPDEYRCAWGLYKKVASKADPVPESSVGADFALVIWLKDGSARLALFQAKKSYTQSQKSIRINPWAKRSHAQPVTLVAASWFALRRSGTLEDARRAVESRLSRVPMGFVGDLHPEKLNFAYYVAYISEPWLAVSIDKIPTTFLLSGEGAEDALPLDSGQWFESVIEQGFGEGEGWLPVDVDELKSILPQLVDVMPVVAVDDSGQGVIPEVSGVALVHEVAIAPGLSGTEQLREALKGALRVDPPRPKGPRP